MSAVHRVPHPRETLDRCALRSQLRGDPLVGTAFPASRLLLVEQPGPWGRTGLTTSRFDVTVATELQRRANHAGVRLQVIRRPGRTAAGDPRRFAYVDAQPGAEAAWWGTYSRDADLLDLPLDQPERIRESDGVVPDNEPVYLVCAHSRHDACCALRGRNVAAALAAQRPGRVWECSHLGGDRFAANVLVLPLGLLYGRVLPFAAAEFTAATEAGEVVGALLRGRIGLPPHAQAALAHGYDSLAVRRAGDLHVRGSETGPDGTVTVVLATPHGEVAVALQAERVGAAGLTCANPGPGSYLWYRPIGVAALADDVAD
jgi:hypothetical protein